MHAPLKMHPVGFSNVQDARKFVQDGLAVEGSGRWYTYLVKVNEQYFGPPKKSILEPIRQPKESREPGFV